MKAVVYDRFGPPDVLTIQELPDPPAQSDRVRVQVYAAALNPKDVLIRKGKMRWSIGGRLPRTPGYDIAGVLLDDAPGLPEGTPVYGMIQDHMGGGCAEIVSLPMDQIAQKPASLSMAEAASLPLAGLTALQGLRDELLLQDGETVLLNGASGGVGTLAVQMAKAMGATVWAVCSTRNAALVESLGAERVIDYTETSLDTLRDLDKIYDIYGSFPWHRAKASLKPGGRYCTTIPTAGTALRGALRRVGLHQAALVVVRSRRPDLDQMRQMVDAGTLRPLIESVVSFADSAAGHRQLETRRTRGKVVVQIRD
ncbi:MAG: NADP-dependent oxidoreductase [Myxococcota bacterium]